MVAVFASQASFALPSARLCYTTRGLDMEPARESAWTEHEKVYLLAEILKGSLSSHDLFAILRDHDVQPQWTEIALPQGRSMRSCQAAFSQLVNQRPPMPTPLSQPVQELPKKRPVPADFPAASGGRPLQPRPPIQYGHEHFPPQYGMGSMGGEPAQKKKRGRPTKAEAEARAIQAAARGEVYPPPSRKKLSTPSSRLSITGSEGAPGTPIAGPASAGPIEMVTTPQHSQMEVVEETSSSKRRRGKPTPLELGEGPGELKMQPPESPLQPGPTRPDSGRALYHHPTPGSDEPGSATERRDVRMEGVDDYPPHSQAQHNPHQVQSHPHPHSHPPPPPPPPPQQQSSTPRSFKETVGM